MAIDLNALGRITGAGHPDGAIVGMPVSMLREIERELRRAAAGRRNAAAAPSGAAA